MLSSLVSAGTSLTTGLPCFVTSTGSPVACTSSITARQSVLNFPAGICFISLFASKYDHSYDTIVIFRKQSPPVSPPPLRVSPLQRLVWRRLPDIPSCQQSRRTPPRRLLHMSDKRA